MSETPLHTPLYQAHLDAGAKMVEFAGWCMPINYGSQIKEHEQVRTSAGMFDVSHMCIVDVTGKDSLSWLRGIFCNDMAKLTLVGKALYTGMLNEKGGVIDDLLAYYLGENHYRLVVNAGNRDKDLKWLRKTSEGKDVQLTERKDLATLAIQGPKSIDKLCEIRPDWASAIRALKVFQGQAFGDWFVARTGYTGEEGVEVLIPAAEAISFFNELKAAGVAPCGLGARDTLRLEAGMNLYGHDMDEDVSPLIAGMGWTVAWEPAERDFIGRKALEAEKAAGIEIKQVGLVLNTRGVLRDGMKVVVDGVGEGVITSGTFSPTLGLSVGIARVPKATGATASVDMRGTLTPVQVVKLPFVRNGKKVYE